MPPYRKQNTDVSDLSLTDSDRFGSAADGLQWPQRDCLSPNGRTVTVKRQQRVHAQVSRSLNSKSVFSHEHERRSSFDTREGEDLRRSLQSDELMSALTPFSPPPPPPPPPAPARSFKRQQSKAVQGNVEKYKELYDVMLHDVLDALEADDPSAAGGPAYSAAAAHAIINEAGRKSAAHQDQGTSDEVMIDEHIENDAVVKRIKDHPARGVDPPPFMSDDLLTHIIAGSQSQDPLSDDDSTVVIDFDDENHDIMSLLSGITDRKKVNALVPVNKKMISANKSNRQPRRDDVDKKRTSKSGGDRGRQRRSTSKPKQRTDDKKQRQPSRSKSSFARFVRDKSPSPTTDERGATATAAAPKRSKSPCSKLRSIIPFRLNRSSSNGQNSSGASVSSNTNRRRRSREGPGRRPSKSGSSGDANRSASTNSSSDEMKKAKLFKKMKTLASGLKPSLKLLPSKIASHKFKVGDMAEYSIGSRVCLEDLNYFIAEDGYTKMCVVRILEVGEDAVYETPLYTILLPNGNRRQTNSNFLSPCSKQTTTESYRCRHQTALKSHNRSSSVISSRSSSRSSSKHRSRSRSSESHRSNSSRHSSKTMTSSHRSSSSHNSRRSPSHHQSKSNDRSSPRSSNASIHRRQTHSHLLTAHHQCQDQTH